MSPEEMLTHLIDVVQATAPLAAELREHTSQIGLIVSDAHRDKVTTLEETASQLETTLARAVGLLWRYRALRSPELPLPAAGRVRRRDEKLAALLRMPDERTDTGE